ncbi:unnamed protein product [Polarella glacialis]|uniref:RNase NYN domain-containing protein n=1 Tax=Polarella glacialis TaxID=89957 RepID=A0A813ERU6_POLGL|nr:unnamed protein product [Polarella glacialis]
MWDEQDEDGDADDGDEWRRIIQGGAPPAVPSSSSNNSSNNSNNSSSSSRNVTQQPVAKQPLAKAPVAKHPALAKQPAAIQQVAKAPVAKHPAAIQQVAKAPVAKQPAVFQQVAKAPVAKQPAVFQPAVAKFKAPVVKQPPAVQPPVVKQAAVVKQLAVKPPMSIQPVVKSAPTQPVVKHPAVVKAPVSKVPSSAQLLTTPPVPKLLAATQPAAKQPVVKQAAVSKASAGGTPHAPLFGNFDISDEEMEEEKESVAQQAPVVEQAVRSGVPRILQARPKVAVAKSRPRGVGEVSAKAGAAGQRLLGKVPLRYVPAHAKDRPEEGALGIRADLGTRPAAERVAWSQAKMQRQKLLAKVTAGRSASAPGAGKEGPASTAAVAAPWKTGSKFAAAWKPSKLGFSEVPAKKGSGKGKPAVANPKAGRLWTGATTTQGHGRVVPAPKEQDLKRKAPEDEQFARRNKLARTSAAPGPENPSSRSNEKDLEGRSFDYGTVVVNFANVGATFGKVCLDREAKFFDWEGVRRCVRYLNGDRKLKVIGVIHENFTATDNNQRPTKMPQDIEKLCDSINLTPRVTGDNHSSNDDEMTIKCAYRRNCLFLDNDNYRDWLQQMRNERCREWLNAYQNLLHVRYYFDKQLGCFDLLEGNNPTHSLAAGQSSDKRALWTMRR